MSPLPFIFCIFIRIFLIGENLEFSYLPFTNLDNFCCLVLLKIHVT